MLKPGDPGYGDKPIFNAMHQRHPALIVRCTGTADVVDAVRFARQHGLLVAVRGGGHSVAGHSSCDGGMVLDLTRMRGVEVDPDAGIARVQGGALWGDVDRETQAFGLVVPGGVVSETGVAGLTLGGGEGWVRRKYGLTIDSLLSARVVCADGSVRTASPISEPDLFWALRGGGGNFGIVTSFEFRAHPLGRSSRSPAFSMRSPMHRRSSPDGATSVWTHPTRSRRLRWRSPCRPPRTCPRRFTTGPA